MRQRIFKRNEYVSRRLEHRVSPAIGRALAYAGGTHTESDIDAAVASGAMQRWGNGDSVIVTEIQDTPHIRGIHFFLAQGKLAGLEAMVPGILDWARTVGCTRATFTGRFGWQRSFVKQFGFTEDAIMMVAKL